MAGGLLMITNVATEKTYSIGYFKSQSKGGYGISINVTGGSKTKVLKEAREMLVQAIKDTDSLTKTEV
jgi:hypothetical protein